jgi:hypothetical protein
MDYFVVFASFVVKRRAFQFTTKITKGTKDEEYSCLLPLACCLSDQRPFCISLRSASSLLSSSP